MTASAKNGACVKPQPPTVLFLVPHPDDETLTGLLPLRLHLELGWRVIALPVSFGSDATRRTARRREFRAACRVLGFTPRMVAPEVESIGGLLRRLRPDMVFLPHAQDLHPRHQATHKLGIAAMDWSGQPYVAVETEYWHPNLHPNLMVSAARGNRQILQRALACHVGEMARAHYDRSFSAWLQDNARRGAERIGGFGASSASVGHAVLYRARLRTRTTWKGLPISISNGVIRRTADLARLVEICRLANAHRAG